MSERLLDLGDAVILDRGRGQAFSIARHVAVAASGDAPFLELAEADGPAADRAVLGWEPHARGSIWLLRPAALEGLAVLAARADARLPSTLEAPARGVRGVECARRAFGLVFGRVGRVSTSALPGAPVAGLLPEVAPGAAWLVGLYGSVDDAVALVVRAPDVPPRGFVGVRVPLERLAVLPNRARGPGSGA